VLDRLQTFLGGLDSDAALVLVVLAKAHIAVDFGNDRVILGTTGLEQFRHAGQTPGDVLGLGTLARDTRHHVTGPDLLPVLDREDGVDRHRIGDRVTLFVTNRFAVLVDNDDLWLQLVATRGRAPVGYDLLGHAGGIVGLVAHRKAADQIDLFRQ